jgi:hypothetical protein
MDFVHFKLGERHHRFYNCRYVCKFVQFSGTFISTSYVLSKQQMPITSVSFPLIRKLDWDYIEPPFFLFISTFHRTFTLNI